MGFKPFRHRAEAVAHGRGIVIVVDPDHAAEHLGAAGAQLQVFDVKLAFGEQVLAVNVGIVAVHVPAPAVERADEARLGAVARGEFAVAGQRHATVAAGVVEGLHAIGGAHDNDGVADIVVFHPVTGFGDLLKPGGHLPDVRPDMVQFRLVEIGVIVTLGRDPFGIVDGKRHVAKAAIC